MQPDRRDVRLLIETCRLNDFTCFETYNFISKTWGDGVTSESNIRKLFREFSMSERQTFGDHARSGRPATSVNDDNSGLVQEILSEHPHASVREFEYLTGVPKSTVFRILTDSLSLKCVTARWMSYTLSEVQKAKRVEKAA